MTGSKAFRYEFTSVDAATHFYKRVDSMPDIKSVQYPQKNMVYDYMTVIVSPHPSCLFSLQQKLKLDNLAEKFKKAEKKRAELIEKSNQHREERNFQAAMQCLRDASKVFDNIWHLWNTSSLYEILVRISYRATKKLRVW